MKFAAKIIVKGMVQGVGYRYFCYKKALQYEITGYVKNLFNGDVELETEGEKNMTAEFIKDLKTGPLNAYVKSVNVEMLPYENKYQQFNVH